MAPASRRRVGRWAGARCGDAEGESGIYPPQPPCGSGARCCEPAPGFPAVRGIAGRRFAAIRGEARACEVRDACPPRGVCPADFLRDVRSWTVLSIALGG